MKHKASEKSPPVVNGVSKPVVCWTRGGKPICGEYQIADDVYLSTDAVTKLDVVEWEFIGSLQG